MPRGTQIPEKNILQAIAKRNPDGFGFVSDTKFFKSMDFEEFYAELAKVDVKENLIIHARWATHGTVSQKNCHPFYNEGADAYFAHNGILSIRPVGDLTDSETAFRYRIAPLIQKHGLFSKEVTNMVASLIGGSKFAIMKDGKVRLFGHFEKVDGVYYSNLNFLSALSNFRTYLRFAS